MRRTLGIGAALLLGGSLLASPRAARAADDDLAVVKHAVQSADGPAAPALAEEPAAKRSARPAWLRVRVVEKGDGKRVSINVPLALVRALGDLPVDWGCHQRQAQCRVRLSEVLQALDAGQSLVEVKDDGAQVRVWIE